MCYVQKLLGIAEQSFPLPPSQPETRAECVPLSLDISALQVFSSTFLSEDTCAEDSKTVKELKDAFVIGLGHLLSKTVDKATTYPRTIHLPAVTFARVQAGSFILNTAD